MKFKKPLLLALFLSTFILNVSAQEEPHFKIAFGLNLIDNSNTMKPWDLDGNGFSNPLYGGMDYQFNDNWSLGVNASINKLKVQGVESNFTAIGMDVNYYIISNTSRSFMDFYGIAGMGVYRAFGNSSGIVYPGLGFNYWFSDHIGVNLTGKANFAMSKDVVGVQNYFNYTLGLIWRPTQKLL